LYIVGHFGTSVLVAMSVFLVSMTMITVPVIVVIRLMIPVIVMTCCFYL
jgi:hypothetical protein